MFYSFLPHSLSCMGCSACAVFLFFGVVEFQVEFAQLAEVVEGLGGHAQAVGVQDVVRPRPQPACLSP
jgi:Fe-S-cluster-containing hydrogenase component 2